MNLLRSWIERNQLLFVDCFCVWGTEVDLGVDNKDQISGINSKLWKN